MKKIDIFRYFVLLFCMMLILISSLKAQKYQWEKVDEGLYLGEFNSPYKSQIGDSKISIIKISPQYYSFKLICASEYNESCMTVEQWSKKYNLIAAINAGMFQSDYKSNVGYMKNFSYINNPSINSKYFSVAAFNPIHKDLPLFKIYDIDKMKMQNIIKNYNTVIQNLRLIKRPGKNRWSQQSKKWSEVALGQDNLGNVLFIFCRSPFSMHDFNNVLLKLPINIVCAQHLEGGPEASLYFSYNGKEIKICGSFETAFNESESNTHFWDIPNVIGIVKNISN